MSVQKEKREQLMNKKIQRRDTGLMLDDGALNNSRARSVEVWVGLKEHSKSTLILYTQANNRRPKKKNDRAPQIWAILATNIPETYNDWFAARYICDREALV